jgi:hypothetical protein
MTDEIIVTEENILEPDDLLYFNGVNGTTGGYLVPPMSVEDLTEVVKSQVTSLDQQGKARLETQGRIERARTEPHYGWSYKVKKEDPKSAGWGVVFHRDEDQAVKEALEPLIAHRRKQLGVESVKDTLHRYEPNDTVGLWLARHGNVSHGNPDPRKVPYYLLVVGSPERIPYSFGYLLDAEYAVGRLHFDTPEEYAEYARRVVEYETAETVPNGREAVFFATRHDQATLLSAELLVKPLADGRGAQGAGAAQPGVAADNGFRTRKLVGAAATKGALADVLRGGDATRPPAFLFTASHGLSWEQGDARQAMATGALLCQGWAGPANGEVPADCYFAAADLPDDAKVQGLIAFHFACFGAGTPSHTRFPDKSDPNRKPKDVPKQIATQPFFSPLPKALLKRGALACIGHVDKAWNWSFQIPGRVTPQINTFENAIGRMLRGEPVGYAMEDFNDRNLLLTKELYPKLEQISFFNQGSLEEFAEGWTQMSDAESYVVMGDPAVRLRADALHP